VKGLSFGIFVTVAFVVSHKGCGSCLQRRWPGGRLGGFVAVLDGMRRADK
jgi:hypothetical protein